MDLRTPEDLKPPEPLANPHSILWIILPALLLMAGLSVSWCGPGMLKRAREGTASSLISQLSQAAKAYELDFECYPPSDGTGSRSLALAMAQREAKVFHYFEFAPDYIVAGGNIRNPVNEEKIIYYRCPGKHNPKTFDLWCEDSKGRVDGINNWEKGH